MHRFLRVIAMGSTVAATAALSPGCNGNMLRWLRWGEAPSPLPDIAPPVLINGHPMVIESERANELGRRESVITLQITFDVLRVDLPLREIRHSLKVWNHVDEGRSDPRLTALLARNGLRIGTAAMDAWPALRILFEANDAKSRQVRHVVQGGAPLSLRLGELDAGESVFEYQRDGRLVGRTFDRGTKFLQIDYALDPADPARTIVRVTPELRRFSAGKHWQNIDGRIREAPRYEGRLYSELSTDMSIAPGEFLVIGPSETARLESLVGSRFLTARENNVTYETVICLTPQPVRVDRSGR